jgi:nitrite reductase (NADH) large subunit
VWICHCKGVTDGQIRSAINAGARTPVEIGAHCRAGTGCGGCLPEVCRLLDDHLSSQAYDAACRECPLFLEHESELLSA